MPLLAVLALLALGLALALAAVQLVSAERDGERAEARTAAQRQAALVQARIGQVEAVVAHAEPAGCSGDGGGFGPGRVVQADPVSATVVCLEGSDPATARGPAVEGLAALLDDAEVVAALAQARDDGASVLGRPVGEGGPSVLVAPLYRSGGEVRHVASSPRLQTRRAEIAGWVAGVIDAEEVLAGAGRRWRLEDGGVRLAGTPALGDDVVRAEIPALDRRWVLATPVGDVSWLRPGLVALVALVLLGVVLLWAAARQRRDEIGTLLVDAHRAEARAGAAQALAGIVQQSPDLDAILPALAVRLSDELELDGLSLAVASPRGGEREIFVHGTAPDRGVRPTAVRERTVEPGRTVAVDLHRADRSIAVLRVRAGTSLDAGALEVLHLAGEMVTSAIVAARSIEQQQEAVRRLESLDELKTTFLGVASHELRTPATAISGLASLLAQRWDALTEDDRRAFAQRIATNADSLNALVQDLLDFARLERGDLQLSMEPVDLSHTVDGLLDRLDTVWGNHTVERRIEPDVGVLGDPNALERVVTNLVSNAAKFSPAGATVTVTVARGGDRAVLSVDDSGPGVPAEEREKIFVRFFRGAGDSVVRTRGVGIGLSVVQDFVLQMGGVVRVEDSPAGGARFVVDLPVHDRAREEMRDAAST